MSDEILRLIDAGAGYGIIALGLFGVYRMWTKTNVDTNDQRTTTIKFSIDEYKGAAQSAQDMLASERAHHKEQMAIERAQRQLERDQHYNRERSLINEIEHLRQQITE